MTARCLFLALMLAASMGVGPVPVANRIDAKVTATVSAPADSAMHMPTDVAADRQGRIFVADGARDRILRFTADGKLDAAIEKVGPHKLLRPVGITVDAKDRLWIADTGNHRVLVADSDGKLVELIDLPKPEGEQAHGVDPTDVVVTPDLKRTYVVDNENHRILIRDNASGAWTVMGKMGRALGQFQWPFMLCLGERGYVYVTEAIGCRVQQISPTDRWAGELGSWGVEGGQFYRPKGIVADARGRVYVGDSTLGVVQVFSARGQHEGVLCGDDGRPLRLNHPMGMCFDSRGRLLVVELKANRVAVVSLAREGKP